MNCTHPLRDENLAQGYCAVCPARTLGVCSVLTPELLQNLLSCGVSKTYDAGTDLLAQGEDARSVFSIQEGVVMLSRSTADGRRQVLSFLSSGDFIGLSQASEYPFTARATTMVKACKFPSDAFTRLVESAPVMARELLARASETLMRDQEHTVLLGCKNANERIASFLLLMSDRAGARGDSRDTIFLPMTRADIADYLGLTTETVSRGITALKTRNIIRLLPHSAVRIVQRELLERIAEAS